MRASFAGDSPCPFPWHFVGIDPEGNVQPCGWWFEEEPVGNLGRQSFLEVWRGEPFERVRADLRRQHLRGCCQRCPSAGMGLAADDAAFAVRDPSCRTI